MPSEIQVDSVTVKWFGHASFVINGSKNVYIDPHVLPEETERVDIILVTHDHFDHCNVDNIKRLRTENTKVFGPPAVMKKLGFGSPINIDSVKMIDRVKITGTDAYNLNKFRSPGNPFHPRGLGIGFLIEIDGKTIYHAGDTDKIPEMSSLGHVDIALLPSGGTYTMTMSEAAEAANVIHAEISIPMHYNSDKYGIEGINADPEEFANLVSSARVLKPLV